MWLDVSTCNCIHLPVGLYVLSIVALLLLIAIIIEIVDYWSVIIGALEKNREATIIGLIFVIAIILILILPGKPYYSHAY